MITAKGKYTSSNIMTNDVEETAYSQILEICNTPIFDGAKIVCMPDIHAGKGSTIGFTCEMSDYIVPNIVGVDISCTVSAYFLGNGLDIDYKKLDKIIHENVPAGNSVRKTTSPLISKKLLDDIKRVSKAMGEIECYRDFLACGSLGGGNHFCSIECSGNGDFYLMLHSGSRNLGKRVCEFHQNRANKNLKTTREIINDFIKSIPPEQRQKYIEDRKHEKINTDFAYLFGVDLEEYADHSKVCDDFAKTSHKIMAHEVCKGMGWNPESSIVTTHNYVEFLDNKKFIIRKGAVRALEDEKFLLPMNMQHGSYICTGAGNPDWNYSAPHGAGRTMSRTKAKENLDFEKFKNEMEGIYSTSVNLNTIDEAPDAYKNPSLVVLDATDTIKSIDAHLKPVYNFKS